MVVFARDCAQPLGRLNVRNSPKLTTEPAQPVAD